MPGRIAGAEAGLADRPAAERCRARDVDLLLFR
jgi:hypothetical protein